MLSFVRAFACEAVACFSRAQEAARALDKETTATKDIRFLRENEIQAIKLNKKKIRRMMRLIIKLEEPLVTLRRTNDFHISLK